MYSTEETQRPSDSNTDSDSTVHLRSLEERPALHEEKMTTYNPTEEEEMEDLRAFERRLEELATGNRPRPFRWRLVLGTLFACTAISACHWLEDLRESQSILLRSLSSRGALVLSLATVVVLIIYGVKHATKRPTRGAIDQTRDTLALFQLKCDSDGHLVQAAPIPRGQPPRSLLTTPRNTRAPQ